MLFQELNLSDEILQAVNELGFIYMTEIQEKTIPLMLEGADVIGRSNTGTGKTAAFGIPVIEAVSKEKKSLSEVASKAQVEALILCPTRELAMQAKGELDKFSKFMPWVRPCAVYGGASIEIQIRDLKRGANIVIGTPGRVIDHIERHTLRLDNVRTVVLDEADEMLQMGFREDVERILESVPEERQTALFSATMPPEILAITKRFQKNPKIVKVQNLQRTVDTIEQFYYEVAQGRKTEALQLLLTYCEPKSAMVFCNTKKMVDELTDVLTSKNFKVAGLHGDMKQMQRTAVMNAFKSGRTAILIATDVAARGIDVSGVDAVFNYDLPQDNEYYIHRIGRTGRAGKAGTAYTLVCTRKQVWELQNIAKYTKAPVVQKALPNRVSILEKKIGLITDKIERYANETPNENTLGILEKLGEKGLSAETIAAALITRLIDKEIKNIPSVPAKTTEFRQPKAFSNFGDKNSAHFRDDRYDDRKRPTKKLLPERILKNPDFSRFEKPLVKDAFNADFSEELHAAKAEGANSLTAKIVLSVGSSQKIAPRFILAALSEATGLTGKNFGKIDIFDKHSTVEVPEQEVDYVINAINNGKIGGNQVTARLFDERFTPKRPRGRAQNGSHGKGNAHSNTRRERERNERRNDD